MEWASESFNGAAVLRPRGAAPHSRQRAPVQNRTTDTTSGSEDKLLDAAEEVFADRGYHAASTLEIARRAGVNKTLIHYYFRSKEGLYGALMQRISRQLAPFLEDFSIGDPVEALTTATCRYVRLLADNPRYVRLCAYSALERLDVRGDDEMHEKLFVAASTAIQRGIDQGVFRAEDPRHVLITVEGMCRFFFEHEEAMREQWGDSWDRERIIEERGEHVVNMLLSGLGAKT
jgi:TetR/AcrR family transcriptional regulator